MDLDQKIALAKYGYQRLSEVKNTYPELIGTIAATLHSDGYINLGAHWTHRVTEIIEPRLEGMPHMAGLGHFSRPSEIDDYFIPWVVEQCETLLQRLSDLAEPKFPAPLTLQELTDILKGETHE